MKVTVTLTWSRARMQAQVFFPRIFRWSNLQEVLMVPSYLTSWKPVILSDSENIQETTWINKGGLCYVGKGQRSLTWHQDSNMIATLRSLTQILIGFNLKSMKILRIPGISATATSPEIFQQNLPNFCACPFQVCSILLQFGTTWVPCLHQYLWFMAPRPQNACQFHISYIPKCWTHNFAKFPTIYGGRSSYASIKVHGVHAHFHRDAQSCQSWAQDWSTGQI